MNGHIKFHKGNGPAFNAGEQWKSISGKTTCKVVSVRKFGEGKHDYEVTYEYADGTQHSKDTWNFQVRYHHVADKGLK